MSYIVTSQDTIGMVLVYEDDEIHEHIIYYLSRNLVIPELNYSHIEKLALAVIHTVQRLCHYILLCKNTMVVDVNPFQYVLTKCIIGGNIINGLSSYKSLISTSLRPSQINH